jgi:hypothetical protein
MHVSIFQCDEKTAYSLHPFVKTYLKSSLSDREVSGRDAPGKDRSSLSDRFSQPGAEFDVLVTTDSNDTGERRQIGSYEARRIKTSITVAPSKRATARASTTEIDGWYIDLPGLGCRDRQPDPESGPAAILFHSLGRHDHVIYKVLGTAQRGIAIDEESVHKEAGNVLSRKKKLLTFSEKELDPSLFELPADYAQATPGHLVAPLAGPNAIKPVSPVPER